MPDLTIKPVAAAGNKLILQDQAGGAVLTTADAGATLGNSTQDNITRLGTVTTGTLASSVTFPANHVIRTFYAQDDGGEHTIADPSAADSVYSELELTITGTNSTSDYLMIILYLSSIYNMGYYGNALHTGIMYSTDSWSSPADGQALITDGSDYQMMRSSMIQSGSTAFHMITSNSLFFRVNHPVTGTYKIRPKFKNNGSSMKINTGHGRSTITALEIKG